MKDKFLRFLFYGCLLVVPGMLQAQNFAGHEWHFGGSSRGIRFSRSDNSASLTTQAALSSGGSAVVNDPVNGNLLFYTNGATVYDVTHTAMPNGGGLNANTAGNQPVVVAKIPGQTTQYYIITNTVAGDIYYTVVDMALFGNAIFPTPALGDIDITRKNVQVTALAGRSEAMLTVPHSNGTDFWLITHENGTANYAVTLFTAAGPTTTTTYSGVGLIQSAANFSYHPGTKKIAVTPGEDNRDVEILSFLDDTGVLSFSQRVLSSGPASPTNQPFIYDTEWSTSGDFLYLSRMGEAGIQAEVLQFELNPAVPGTSLNPVLPQPNTIFRSYGIQMAPDSAIYHLYQATSGGPFLLGKITDTDTVATSYTAQAFPGNINFNGRQFPAFAPASNVNLTVTFIADGLCANAPTSFFPTVSPAADSLVWDFGDNSQSSDWSPVHTYEAGGPYDVSVTAYLNGQSVTTPQQITITDFDTQITLVQDTTACTCELPFPGPLTCNRFSVTAQVQGSGSPQLQWYGPGGPIPGATSATLQPDSAGYYYLVATVGGCSTYAGVNIKEYDVQDQRANIWYFGDHAGIDFNPLPDDPAIAISNPVMNAPAGTATISDRNGQVIFFTDGDKVWNRQNVEIASGIGGDPASAQAALIIPVPGDETLYYIFTTDQVQGANTYELRYSLFDLKMNGGTGGLVEQNVLLFTKSTERITGNANWLIAHEYGNNSFRAYRVSDLGIGNPVISAIGSDHLFTSAENGQGYMKLGTNNKIAVALSTQGVSNKVEIFDFTDSTGVVSNFQTANLNSTTGQVYGVEFSGNKLFATLKGPTSKIYEFFLDSLGVPYQVGPPSLSQQTFNEELGAIQTGPDGQVYVAVNNKPYLGVIQVNGDTTIASTFVPNQFPLNPPAGTSSKLGLPNFIQTIADPVQGPGISITGFCLGDSTNFAGTGTDPIDVFSWQVRQGGSVITMSSEQNFSFIFATAGNYNVSLKITNRCGLDTTLTQTFTINNVPPDPTNSVVLCTGSAVLDANPGGLPGLRYLWSTGDTTRTITVNQQAIYGVTVTNAAGCSTDGSIVAADNRPIVELGPNLTICENTVIAALDAQNPGATYAWTINGVAAGTSRTQSVDTSVPSPPTYEYEVTVTDPITTCFVKDSVIYTINESPVFTATPSNTLSCAANDGSIAINITAPATSLFSYSVTGPSTTASGVDRPVGAVPPVTGLGAGAYGVTVTDQVSGCASVTVANINDPAFTVAVAQNGTCDPDITINVTTGVATAVTYRVIDSGTGANVPPGVVNETDGDFATMAVPSGSDYVVEVTETASGCVASSNPITITQAATLPVTIDDSQLCANKTVTASAAGATSFAWVTTPTNGVSPTNAATVTVLPGTWNLQVTVDDGPAGSCPGIGTLTVIVDQPITADITQDDACADQVFVTATPNGPYLYRWYRNGVLDLALGGPQVLATSANDNQQYRVDIFNPANGCTYASPTEAIQIDGELTVSITSTPPCDNAPFTLTAAPNRTVSSYAWAHEGTTIGGQVAPTLEDTRAGTYEVTVTQASCTATGEIEVIPSPSTPGNLSPLARICPDPANQDPDTRQAVLDPGAFDSYNWFKDGNTMGITTPTLTVVEEGIYEVDLINSFGCASSDKTEVIVDCDPVIVGPNAFRPGSSVVQNGEMVNQAFKLFTFFIDDTDFAIFIFNRWGEMVYQSNERDFRWNGGYNNNLGQLLPPGTYSYLVRYKSSYRPEQGVQEKRGGVVLMR